MSEVAKWLSRFGLSRYQELFEQHQIDFDTLRVLSEGDLREMGIPIGPRRKIVESLEALKSRRDDRGPAGSFLEDGSEVPERRQLTILFCDIVGSTEYADTLSPEDFRDLTQEYLARCTGIVHSHDGVVVSYIGDAVQALFGYPHAREDDAERAIATAFDIITSVHSISIGRRPSLRVRLGIASGLAVVSGVRDLPIGGPTIAFGPVTHLASRLQTLAEPQAVLVDDATYKEAEGAFKFTDQGRHTVKGFADPMQIWRADGPLWPESRFARRINLSPLIGRNNEIQRVVERWNRAEGERLVHGVLISGEPGIGKSRLVHEVSRRISGNTHITLQCYPTYSHSALFPFLSFLQRHAGIGADDSAAAVRGKLEQALAPASVPTDVSLPIFAKLLSGGEDDKQTIGLGPARQREITQNVLCDIFRGLGLQKPLMLCVEDAHWTDSTSWEVIDRLLGGDFPMLLVITTRQGLPVNVSNAARLEELALSRLDGKESLSLLRSLVTEAGLSNSDCKAVLDRAEGVPLYLEEFARATLEARSADKGRTSADRQLTAGVPSSLQSSLIARLDSLGPAKEVAQVASVIGRVFDVKLLRHLCRVADSVLDGLLERLVDARLIAPQLAADGPSYAFSHAILQEAALGTLIRERRQSLHERVAQALEAVHPKLSALRPEIVAQHYSEAGSHDAASDHWFNAGIAASQTWAKTEAARMFALALESLEKLPSTVERKRKALQCELERGDVLYAAYGYVTHEGSDAYRRAMTLSEELGEPDAPIRVLDGLFGTHFNSAQFDQSEGAADRLIDIGNNGNNLKALVLGLEFKGMSRFCQGDFVGAKSLLERALQHEDIADVVGSDFPSMALLYLSWTLHILGYRQNAVRTFDKAERIVRKQTAYRLAACLGDGCILFVMRNEGARVRVLVDELIPLARDNGFNLWLNMALFFDGWVTATVDADASGLQAMQEVCDALGEQEIDKTCYLGLLADAYIRMGDFSEAANVIDRALRQAAATDERYFEAELVRLRGVIELNGRRDPGSADVAFREALELARSRKARGWELKAANSLADLLRSQGKPEAAERELGPLVEWFDRCDRPPVGE